MPTGLFAISIDTELLERFQKSVPSGMRSKIIQQFIKEYCDSHKWIEVKQQ